MKHNLKNRPKLLDLDLANHLDNLTVWFEGFEAELREDNDLAKKKIKIRRDAHSFAQMWWWKGYLARGDVVLGKVEREELDYGR